MPPQLTKCQSIHKCYKNYVRNATTDYNLLNKIIIAKQSLMKYLSIMLSMICKLLVVLFML